MLTTPPPVDQPIGEIRNGLVYATPQFQDFMQRVYRELNRRPLAGFEMGAGVDAGDLMWRAGNNSVFKVVDVP